MHHTSKKESKKEKEKNKAAKNFESGPSEYVELKMHASIHWTTSVNAGDSRRLLSEVFERKVDYFMLITSSEKNFSLIASRKEKMQEIL